MSNPKDFTPEIAAEMAERDLRLRHAESDQLSWAQDAESQARSIVEQYERQGGWTDDLVYLIASALIAASRKA
jgi:hypothetical protein